MLNDIITRLNRAMKNRNADPATATAVMRLLAHPYDEDVLFDLYDQLRDTASFGDLPISHAATLGDAIGETPWRQMMHPGMIDFPLYTVCGLACFTLIVRTQHLLGHMPDLNRENHHAIRLATLQQCRVICFA